MAKPNIKRANANKESKKHTQNSFLGVFVKNIYYLAWIQSIVAMLGSLFFSEVMKWTPCVLCWYQRIAMYPLVFLIAVGIVRKDKKLYEYVLPIAVVGWAISLYHNLLYYKIIPEAIVPCTNGVSCTTKFFAWFGFITIPLLSFTAFTVIITCMLIARKYNEKL